MDNEKKIFEEFRERCSEEPEEYFNKNPAQYELFKAFERVINLRNEGYGTPQPIEIPRGEGEYEDKPETIEAVVKDLLPWKGEPKGLPKPAYEMDICSMGLGNGIYGIKIESRIWDDDSKEFHKVRESAIEWLNKHQSSNISIRNFSVSKGEKGTMIQADCFESYWGNGTQDYIFIREIPKKV